MVDVFISYAGKDQSDAATIAQKLNEMGIMPFLAPKSIKGGDEFDVSIKQALRECKEVFLLLTPNSLSSEWVKYECGVAWGLDKHVVPILLHCSPTELPAIFARRQTRDFHELDRIINEYMERRLSHKMQENKRKEIAPNKPSLHLGTANFIERLDSTQHLPPLEFVENSDYNPNVSLFPDIYKDRIMIDTIHAGDWIPDEFRRNFIERTPANSRPENILHQGYIKEKDWGANYIALALTQALNLPGFYRVNIARILLDFGRFPGVTPPGADHLHRFAISYPFSHYLDYDRKRKLIENYYDKISEDMGDVLKNKIIKLAIHTYDKFNAPYNQSEQGTLRPLVSLLYSPIGYHELKRMPYGIFDKLYPDELGELTADRRLTARISLNLEREGIAVAHNHPYHLPEGSVEVRSQVWLFFRYLRNEFEKEYPSTAHNKSYKMVWEMLLDTNLRSSESETLRSYLHMFRLAPTKKERELECARKAYEEVQAFLEHERDRILTDYRYSPARASSLAIEVRKDYIWKFEDMNANVPIMGPGGLIRNNVINIVTLLAEAILIYLNHDAARKDTEF